MKSGKHEFAFLIVLVVLSSCTSLQFLNKNAMDVELPRYEGKITPISLPIKAEYKSSSVRFRSSTITLEKGKKTEVSTGGEYEVSEVGELLLWELKIVEMKIGAQKISPRLPIVHGRLLTEKSGETIKIELSYPASGIQSGEEPKRGTNEYNSLVAGWPYSFYTVLPNEPVKTGDILFSVPIRECIPVNLMDWLSGLTTFEPIGRNTGETLRWKTTLQGWSHYNEKRVLVGKISERTGLRLKDASGFLSAAIDGYTLIDAETFQPMKGETFLSISWGGEAWMIQGSFSAEIT